MENANPLRILFVEDVPSDAILAERVIRKSGLEFSSQRVDTKDTFLKALDEFRPDIVVSDYSMPEFDGMQALKLSLERDAGLPFILLTGSMNEETAVACMKAGASDYVIKEHMKRLPFAVREVLEQKRIRVANSEAERALRESEEKFRRVVETALEGVWFLDREFKTTEVNDAVVRMLGYSPDELIGRPFVDLLFDEDRSTQAQEFQRRETGLSGQYERRLLCKDGGVKWLFLSAKAVMNTAGAFVGSFAMVTDITERKRAEESRLLLTTAIESSANGVAITDLKGTIVWVNEAFTAMTGYFRTEVLGQNPKFLKSGKQDDSFYKDLWDTISAGKVWTGELINKRKDGSFYVEEMTITPVKTQDGKITHYVALKQDITERKRAEAELRASKAMIDRIINAIPVRVFWKDKNLTYLGCNAIFAHDAGYTGPNDVIGKNDYQMVWRDQAELYRGDDRNVIESGSPRLQIEEPQTTPGGETITLLTSKLPLLDDQGEVSGVLGVYMDVTERKNAENNLRLSEERFRSVWEHSADGMRLIDEDGRIIAVNEAYCKLVNLPREKLVSEIFSVIYAKGGPDGDIRTYQDRFESNKIVPHLQAAVMLWDGKVLELDISNSFTETEGAKKLVLSIFRDVTEQKKSQKRLEEERTLLRTIIDAIPDEICVKDIERKFVLVNPGTLQALKRSSAEIIGKRDEELIPEPFALQAREEEESVLTSGRPFINKFGKARVNPTTGEIERSILISKLPLKDSSGKIVGLVGINRDITEVQRANAALEKERTLLLTLIESIPDEICLKDIAHRFIVVNSGIVRAIGARSIQDMMGKTDFDFMSPELAQTHFDEEDAILESGHPIINLEKTVLNPTTGEIEQCKLTTKVLVRDSSGKKIGILVVNRNVTERKKAEEALRASEQKFRALFEESKDVVYISTADGKLLDINPAGIELFGYGSKEAFLQIDLTGSYADPGEKERFDRQMEKQAFVKDFELVFNRADGKKLTVLETATAVRNKNGEIVQYRGIIRDVTGQRLLESQFMQAQKMESIGTLAGGIAHDFNNILGIVLGHLALLERTRKNDAQFEESIFSISKAVERGASLVRQILTFARKAETELEPVNINLAIKELAKMLEETFPKTVEIAQKLDKTIPIISMDPTQLHQTLLNLCVNARDAMNGQGTLTLATHLVPGRDVLTRFPKATAHHYVHVSVKDTGIGMDEETRQRIFEPFFTTKEKGKGTGLGLAVVYGVLLAHNGFIDVNSEPGAGTTFHLFFPVPEGILTTSETQKGPMENLPRGTETILVVEDEDVLRDLLVKLLEMQGYTAIAACDGEEAVKRFSEHVDEIDLVLSDMGLPKRSGWDAFRMMKKIKPNVRTLFATGYVEPGQKSEILKSGVMRFIHKPYRMEEVMVAIRETLDKQ